MTDSLPPTSTRKTQLDDVKDTEDWAGVTDRAERRRRQNRLNQRAYRQRKQAQQRRVDVLQSKSKSKDLISIKKPSPSPSSSSPSPSKSPSTSNSSEQTTLILQRKTKPTNHQLHSLLEQVTQAAYQNYLFGYSAADNLLTLSRVNVFRAFASNMALLGVPLGESCHDDDAISPFLTKQIDETTLPPSLLPTRLQRTISHHPWLDFFPHPKMRDNLLTIGEDNFDDDQFCMDIMGFWDSSEDCALLVWGEPSDPSSWELTETFLQKWPWVVRGCSELLESTNYWRRQRGEKMLFRYL